MSEAFWAKVKRGEPHECWPWLGYLKPSGHGLTTYKGLCTHASRKAWLIARGAIGPDLCVNHLCDNPACCNPSHLYLGSRTDNLVDRHSGRPPGERGPGRSTKLTVLQLEELWRMRREGALLQECADKFDVHITTVCRYITAIRREKVREFKALRQSVLARRVRV